MSDEEILFHSTVARIYDPIQVYFERKKAPPHRRVLATGLSGDVLEVGVGTGAMIPYFVEHAEDPLDLHGVEPDPGMYRQARETIAAHDVEMDLTCARAEHLPYEDDSFDAVVETGVLCTIPDVPAALLEIARVLAPEGEFRFFDHVHSPGIVGRFQNLLTPASRRVFGNCHLNREVEPRIASCQGLSIRTLEHVPVCYGPLREFVRGVAVTVD